VPVRPAIWTLHLALPVAGLWLLIARSDLDGRWENHTAHLWLVLITALISLGLAVVINAEAVRRSDARLVLVSFAFAASAGFLALHALATPDVFVGRNTGFVLATPAGLLIASVFAAASAVELADPMAAVVVRLRLPLRAALLAGMGVWTAATLARIPPFDHPVTAPDAQGAVVVIMLTGAALYLAAALGYYRLYQRRPSVVLVSLITAFVLLAEALVAVAYGRSWQASWWEWHVLMALAFAFIAYSAGVQWRREGSPTGLFAAISMRQAVKRMQEDLGAALETMAEVIKERDGEDAVEPVGRASARIAERFDLTERQAEVLASAGQALAHERDLIRRQAAIVAVGQEASVIREADDLLSRVIVVTRTAFGRDELRIDLLRDGRLDAGSAQDVAERALAELSDVEESVADGALLAVPLTVKGKPSGVLSVHRPRGGFAERDRALLDSFASQLSIALENARLYRQLDTLFRGYMSPDVATSLIADPEQAALGGAVAEVTVLMADLRGFTPFSERSSPHEVVAMLNSYFGIVVPIVLDEGGTVTQFVGDALMAIFNAPVRQSDHAARAARAALRAQEAATAIAQEGWPRFRMGINTGPALVGNIGAQQLRNFTAIGDTTNLAARLEGSADAGGVVISGTTYAQIRDVATAEWIGELVLKGKSEPVPAYRLISLQE